MDLLGNIRSILSGGKCDVRKRFELVREAVSGTMSEFYKARDRQTDRIVGLKVLDLQKTRDFESRFKGLKKPTEGEIAISLEHPRIVKTYEHGLTTAGEQYLVMEFLEGAGLNSLLIGRSDLLEGHRVDLIRQAAEAIRAVHGAGYIHRDVCPRNFVVSPDGSSMTLIDFGLTVPATTPYMLPGNRTGTPNYMAPELVRRQKTDQRLDVFAFGVTAYEICSYELPWTRGTTGQAAMGHANVESTDIGEYCPNIHRKLAKAITSCLERNPEKRCPSMDQFLNAIRGVSSFHEERAGG